MDVQKVNMQKLMAMLSQTQKPLEPLKNIDERVLDVKYINHEARVEVRKVRLFTPQNAKKPMPLVFVAHYEMPLDSVEIRDYLKSGYAVVSCVNVPDANAALTRDDLVFNNAALYTLRNMSEFDTDKIAVVGGSAGGYMSLMLNAMQLGICVSVANGPICNVYFNFYEYFHTAQKFNEDVAKTLSAEDLKNPVAMLSKFPVPFVGAICAGGGFTSGVSYIDPDDFDMWEAVSPVTYTEDFCNPLYINQATSDVLVPIEQLTKKYTYPSGETLPKGYDLRMGSYPGKLNYALCDRLPGEQLNLFKVPPITDGKDVPFIFDESKRFNVCICDEGAPQSYCSHNAGIANGRTLDIDYLSHYLNLGASKTNVLTAEKLLTFAQRYDGNAKQLVCHDGVDDSVYGSGKVYREEIVAELRKWVTDNGRAAYESVVKKAKSLSPEYAKTLDVITKNI